MSGALWRLFTGVSWISIAVGSGVTFLSESFPPPRRAGPLTRHPARSQHFDQDGRGVITLAAATDNFRSSM